MNSVCPVGVLSRNPAVRFEGDNGSQVTTFTLAISEPGRDGGTFLLYVNCIAWGKPAEAAADLEAETLVSVEGKLCWRKNIDKQGHDKSSMAVMLRQLAVLQPTAVEVRSP